MKARPTVLAFFLESYRSQEKLGEVRWRSEGKAETMAGMVAYTFNLRAEEGAAG